MRRWALRAIRSWSKWRASWRSLEVHANGAHHELAAIPAQGGVGEQWQQRPPWETLIGGRIDLRVGRGDEGRYRLNGLVLLPWIVRYHRELLPLGIIAHRQTAREHEQFTSGRQRNPFTRRQAVALTAAVSRHFPFGPFEDIAPAVGVDQARPVECAHKGVLVAPLVPSRGKVCRRLNRDSHPSLCPVRARQLLRMRKAGPAPLGERSVACLGSEA